MTDIGLFKDQPEATQRAYRYLWLEDYATDKGDYLPEVVEQKADSLWHHTQHHIRFAMKRAEREAWDDGYDEKRTREWVQCAIQVTDPENSVFQGLRGLRKHKLDSETRKAVFGGFWVDRKDIARPTWDEYFLGLAFLVSRRSHDVQTKHGCVLVDRQHLIIGMGYNGHISGAPDDLPVTRPEKYQYMIHSEPNALASCTIPPRFVPGGVVAYITGRPCLNCAQTLYQNHVREWVLAERKGWTTARPDEEEAWKRLQLDERVSIRWIKPDLRWMVDVPFLEEMQDLGFL